MTGLREVPEPTRGSGPVTCDVPTCRGHRQRCLFGRMHSWSVWYEDAKLQRTRQTFHCWDCGGICTAEEEEQVTMEQPGNERDELAALGPLIREALQELHDATPEQIAALRDIFRKHYAAEVKDISEKEKDQ
jgi:hypothetical protein